MKSDHGSKVIDHVTLDQCLGGARSVKCMVWETSLLDPNEVRALAERPRGGEARARARSRGPCA